jgi:hypothetical protein
MSDRLPSMTWLRKTLGLGIEDRDVWLEAEERVQESQEAWDDPLEDDELREKTWAYLNNYYNDLVRHVNRFTNPIRIFRAVGLVNGVETLRTDALGVYWTWDREFAEVYWSSDERETTTTFVIEAHVDPADVDWEGTLLAYMTYLSEREVRLREGAPVHVVAVYDFSTPERVQVRGAFDARANPRRTRRY